MLQQMFQQMDYKLERLDAVQREVRRLKRVEDEDRTRELTRAALEALQAVNESRNIRPSFPAP